MDEIVILEWTYTPENYFEAPFVKNEELCEITIDSGKVEARFKASDYDPEHKDRDVLHKKIDGLFQRRQLLIHKPYNLSKSTMYKLYPDGRRDATAFVEGAIARGSAGIIDIIISDSDGNIIHNTRQERIDKENEFVELLSKHDNDILLDAMLKSYDAAVNDPENEFVHLYEIRDALDKYSGNLKTTNFFKISEDDWKRFSKLTNNTPTNQSRHRGTHALHLRNATPEELSEVRKISKRFIKAYVDYLEEQSIIN